MQRKTLALAVLLSSVGVAPSFAQAACTQQEAMAKGTQLSQVIQAKMAKDPASGQAMMMKMQPVMQASQSKMMAGGAVDWTAVCAEYDAMIEQSIINCPAKVD